MASLKKQDFYISLTEKHNVLNSYEALEYNLTKSSFYKSNKEDDVLYEILTSIRLFPSYLSPTFKHTNTLKIKKIPQDKIIGYAINIETKQNIETFLKNEFSKKFRSNIKRFLNRFEYCFNASYKMIYGNILKDEYSFLMTTLHDMLVTRFVQRNEKNEILENWEYYLESTFSLINSKKASLFVIYHDSNPVHICVNHHFNNILFVSIPSYDINFAKFALGNISIYKLLEWSLNNNYIMLDMAYGELEYKRRWSNHIYSFEHHIIYKTNALGLKLKANLEIWLIKFKNFLKSKNIDVFIKNIKKAIKKKNEAQKDFVDFEIEDVTSFNTKNLNTIDSENNIYSIIKKPVYDFIYKQKIHINSISIFEIKPQKEYVLAYKNIYQKIIFL
ncbi:GNAT family N-acetyltransferase [Flavivirga sp. 57AJ16]|uniref:GNAT family N-acetyltransferase n=1 Tax=Flavivirga sp. 57AJ16 TaxID=3025307 RepID=UPI002366CE70|nr:GNAT family N-acetyltransferase [Flavivirga sp. 57AJ16]MDD7885844.1 GNAT family N-acetyltransferase [Flavivirga sp. 57AJ16]